MQLIRSYWWLWLLMIMVVVASVVFIPGDFRDYKYPSAAKGFEWNAPDPLRIDSTESGALIRYGRELIMNTSIYLGPKGKVASVTNGMNCQNCHLEAGTKFLGNNYSAVFSTYPKFRARSGTVETIYKRVNDCIERSLNGQPLDSNSREMRACHAYIKWLGKDVPKNIKPAGVGIANINFMNRAADPLLGKTIYMQNCQRCHGNEGQGTFNTNSTAYQYPPLWGDHSYNTGAGLFRMSRLAGYIKYNMPFDLDKKEVHQLTEEESWDVAAFVNSQPRPQKNYSNDWPDISAKPFDHPFGPYSDTFTEQQHKYGLFNVMVKNK